jgi:hypothetical protein
VAAPFSPWMRRTATPPELFEIGNDRTERVAVIRVAASWRCSTNFFGRGDRGDDRDLAAELVGRPGVAFADVLHLGGVQRVDLGPALVLLLMANPQREIKRRPDIFCLLLVFGLAP